MIYLDVSSFRFGSHVVQPIKTGCSILVEAIMRNNSVKLFRIGTSGSGGSVIKTFLI